MNKKSKIKKPHKEAIIAKWIYDDEGRVGEGEEISYTKFYKNLDEFEKRVCKKAVDEVLEAEGRA